MARSVPKKIFLLFVSWRLILFFIAFLAIYVIPRWGGWFPYPERVLIPTGLPSWIWGFGNFDGVHYLQIAQNGYVAANSQAFFPLYPLLIKFLNIFPKNPALDLQIFVDPSYFYTGFILSNVFLYFSLYYFYKLLRLDFDKKVSFWSLVLLLAFPASYYFGAVYTESLFLLLVASSIYYTRRHNFLLAGVLAGLASLTRILGLMLVPFMIIELYLFLRSKKIASIELIKPILGVGLSPFGALAYMLYLKATTGDYLYFLTTQPGFGAERSAKPFILLPQVIYRYFKIFLTIPPTSMKFFNAGLEFVFALVPLFLLVVFWKKMRLSYWVFTLGVLIIPTLTGTFLSMPRFALFSFLLLPLIATRWKKYRWVIVGFSGILAAILISLFTRGYWVA
jgi:Gpi18-like mannosyltransferase